MMNDIKIVWNGEALKGDWVISGGDLGVDYALISAVQVSLFSDGLAPLQPTQLDQKVGLTTPKDRRGWWGDALRTRPIGSRLWQLARSVKADQSPLLLEAQDMCRDALQWLIQDGIVSAIDVQASWLKINVMALRIVLYKPQSTGPDVLEFQYAWDGVA